MTTVDVGTTEPGDEPGRRAGPSGAGRRVRLVVLAVALPVLAVVGVLVERTASTPAVGLTAAQRSVEGVAGRLGHAGSGSAMTALTTLGGPGAPSMGGSSGTAPRSGVLAVTAVCVSADGTGGELAVQVAGVTVVTEPVACADGSDPGAEPAVTVLPRVPATDRWAFDLSVGAEAAVAVVVDEG